MLVLQLLQHIRIGGITGFGFLYRRKAQFFKEEFSQLFGRIDIEFPVGIGIDHGFTVRDPLRQHGAELFQLTAINADLNGAANILRKAFPEAFNTGIAPDFQNIRVIRHAEYEQRQINRTKQLQM